MPTIALIPWLNLAQQIVIDEFALIPLQRYCFTNEFERDTVSRIVSVHYVAEKAVVRNPTLLRFTSKGLIDDLQPDERRRLSDFVELVAMAGIAKRKFFQITGREYCNRDNFQLFLFQVSIPEGMVSYTTRRRDGSANIMAKHLSFVSLLMLTVGAVWTLIRSC